MEKKPIIMKFITEEKEKELILFKKRKRINQNVETNNNEKKRYTTYNYNKEYSLDNYDDDGDNNNNTFDKLYDISFNNYYCNLKPGIYIALKFIYVPEIYYYYYTFFYNNNINFYNESKFSYDDYALLLYTKETDEFRFLLPCDDTRGIMRKVFESNYLDNDENVLILKVLSRRNNNNNNIAYTCNSVEQPIWQEDLFTNHFSDSTVFNIYNIFFIDKNNKKKVKKVIEKITTTAAAFNNNCINKSRYTSISFINPSSIPYCKYVGKYNKKNNNK